VGLKLNGTLLFLVCADGANLPGDEHAFHKEKHTSLVSRQTEGRSRANAVETKAKFRSTEYNAEENDDTRAQNKSYRVFYFIQLMHN